MKAMFPFIRFGHLKPGALSSRGSSFAPPTFFLPRATRTSPGTRISTGTPDKIHFFKVIPLPVPKPSLLESTLYPHAARIMKNGILSAIVSPYLARRADVLYRGSRGGSDFSRVWSGNHSVFATFGQETIHKPFTKVHRLIYMVIPVLDSGQLAEKMSTVV